MSRCQACGREAATKHVEFHQNIGLLVMRLSKSVKGDLCKSCIHSYFWKFTGTNLVMGWWGMISLIVNPFFILNNVGRYVFCLGMPPASAGAPSAELTTEVINRLEPFTELMLHRCQRNDPMDVISRDIAGQAGVTAAQVKLYLEALLQTVRQAK